jgi:tetratricopeptide (TPR) repeat protein
MTPTEPAPPNPSARRRWPILAAAVFVLAATAGVITWRLLARPAPPAPPAVPVEVVDPRARRALEEARRKVFDEPASAAAWGHYGMVLLAHECDDEADRCLAEAERLAPEAAAWPYYRGVLRQKYDPDGAVPFLRRAASLGHPLREFASAARLRLAEALQDRGERAEAAALYREELKRTPRNGRAKFGLAAAALAGGDANTAADLLGTLRNDPFARKKAAAELARIARARGEAKRAEEEAGVAARLPDDEPWPDPLLDNVYVLQTGQRGPLREVTRLERAGRHDEAARALTDLLADYPDDPKLLIGLASNLTAAGRYEEALGNLARATRADPGNEHAHYQAALTSLAWGEALATKGDATTAAERFRAAAAAAGRALAIKPDLAAAHAVRGRALLELRQPDEALAALRQAVVCRPESSVFQLALAEALLRCDRGPEAAACLERARRLAPDSPEVARIAAHLKAGK